VAGDPFSEALKEIGPPEVEPELDLALAKNARAVREHARYRIARYLVLTYATVILATAAYLFQRGVFGPEDVSKSFEELIKIGVIPIAALVMGFYFGSSASGD
jgi:hypothetical protein